MQITLVVERSRPESAESAAHTGRYQRLIEDLERDAQTGVNVVDDLSDVSPEGFVLLSSTVPVSTSLAGCAENLRAVVSRPFLSSENYCLLQSDQDPGGSPHLLADYLAADERAGLIAHAEVHNGVYAAG